MKIIADLHLHSRYSRACSTQLNIANIEKWARVKGLGLVGTGDFCHPKWIEELKKELTEDGTGILRTKSGFPFVLQNEISLIYTQGRGRRIHLVLLAPDFATVDKITKYLLTKGRIDYDGRPIFNITCIEFVKDMKAISDDIEIIPAHVWTPWFGLFGSKTGFDTVEQAFGEQSKHIHALETGLSSDPEMNWQLSNLDGYQLVSFSDSHSFWPWRIGRESTVFEFDELTYKNLIKAIRTGEGLVETIEVDPNYGKYHFDGHRNCNISFDPAESKKHNGICPVCKKPLTIGVLNRVEDLADRKFGFKSERGKPFKRIIPLHEIISLFLGAGIATQKVWNVYNKLLSLGANEFDVLLSVSRENLLKAADEALVDLIIKNREGKLFVKAGYDGEYGVLQIGDKPAQIKEEKQNNNCDDVEEVPVSGPQKGLGDFF
ncbi:MAG: endonuclease Q family protein [Nanoarchaeota archaeon]|nr:endonuclease Q family protein [Nanoarchaeota archaeon]MBU1320724.1 endonuclease Q family protein [Nanoarchaeota archaeon]MBU1598273.1 endonuclease Q family protein [Nanoarchaeota archaeon]MBU2442161.1 endonuclease Q family protein [Nanoarchaeota archaeon]